jgi:phosphatidylinositol glycan class W
MLDHDEYKAAKEAFVSGLHGTSMSEIVLVTIPLPIGLLLLGQVKRFLLPSPSSRSSWCLSVEFLCLVVPSLICVVKPEATIIILGVLAAFAACMRMTVGRKQAAVTEANDTDARKMKRPSFVTHYRAGIMLLTCITILAVDFPVFPRRFAKTETYGTGLMDLGVGAVVFASALIAGSPRAEKRQARSIPRPTVGWSLLVALAFSRFALVKLLGYQEHVTEYGVHWNFFVTLIGVRTLNGWIRKFVPKGFHTVLVSAALVAYEIGLATGLETYAFSAPREGWFSQNREGILGMIGFSAIALIAEAIGREAIWTPIARSGTHAAHAQCTRLTMIGSALLLCVCAGKEWLGLEISRRLTNALYVVWCCAHSTLLLALLAAVDIISGTTTCPPSLILDAMNRNMLLGFLIANVLTGLINMSIQTLFVDDSIAYVILVVYIIIVVKLVMVLGERGFRLVM